VERYKVRNTFVNTALSWTLPVESSMLQGSKESPASTRGVADHRSTRRKHSSPSWYPASNTSVSSQPDIHQPFQPSHLPAMQHRHHRQQRQERAMDHLRALSLVALKPPKKSILAYLVAMTNYQSSHSLVYRFLSLLRRLL
jgi:hypothetical protein